MLVEDADWIFPRDAEEHLEVSSHGKLLATIGTDGAINRCGNHTAGSTKDAVFVTEQRVEDGGVIEDFVSPNFGRQDQPAALAAFAIDEGHNREDSAGLGMGFQKRCFARDYLRQIDVVRMVDRDVLTAGAGDAIIHIGELAAVTGLAVINDAVTVGARDCGGAIGGGVVHKQNLPRGVGLAQDGIEAGTKKTLGVVSWDDNGDQGNLWRHGNGGSVADSTWREDLESISTGAPFSSKWSC